MKCRKRSLEFRDCAKFWSEENDKSPAELFPRSSYRAKFICAEGHEFQTSVACVTSGSWCPYCIHKGEAKLYLFLRDHYKLIKEKKFDWCRNPDNGREFSFDLKICHGYKTLIELDGDQHFIQVGKWHSPEYNQKRDLLKMDMANENGYSVIRITWTMVYRDRGNWKELLIQAIEETDWCSRAFICENNEYEPYQ
jgi:hypothetical protein